jgi:hypothetical protein
MADRLSEAIVCIPFFVPWFYLFVLNAGLTVLSAVKKKHIVLPVRQVLMLWFLATRL